MNSSKNKLNNKISWLFKLKPNAHMIRKWYKQKEEKIKLYYHTFFIPPPPLHTQILDFITYVDINKMWTLCMKL